MYLKMTLQIHVPRNSLPAHVNGGMSVKGAPTGIGNYTNNHESVCFQNA